MTSHYYILGRNSHSIAAASRDAWQPPADLLEVEGGYFVQIDIPGVDVATLEATINGLTLRIRGVRLAIPPQHCRRYIHMEVSRGEFTKIINLPEAVSEVNCRAEVKSGVLEIFLPLSKNAAYVITQLRIKSLL